MLRKILFGGEVGDVKNNWGKSTTNVDFIFSLFLPNRVADRFL